LSRMIRMKLSLRFSNTKLVRLFARAIACSMLLVLPSCCLIPMLRQPQPAPALPTTFTDSTSLENSSYLGIQDFFNDLLLTNLVGRAWEGNRERKILKEEVEIARNEILARQGASLPFLSASANAGLERNSFFTPAGAAERELTAPNGHHFPNPMG